MIELKNSAINFISLLVTSLFGVLIYYNLLKISNLETVGLYNISFLIITISTQLTTFGIQYSVLKEVSFINNKKELPNILFSAISLVLLINLLFSVFFIAINYFFTNINAYNFENLLIPIILFSINKIIYWYYNSIENYKLYALVNPIRFLSYLFFIIYLNSNLKLENIYMIFTFGEVIILLFLSYFIIRYSDIKKITFIKIKYYFYKHFDYGKNSFLTSLLSDLILKIDLIIIFFILGPQFVGVYTYTSTLIEGYIGVITVFRTITNPKLHKLTNNLNEYSNYKYKIKKLSFTTSSIVGFAIIIIYFYFGTNLEIFNNIFKLGFFSLFILTLGFLFFSHLFAFEHILLQNNFQKLHSKIQIFQLTFNIIFNIILVMNFGINGAAIATVLSYFIYFSFIVYYANKNLNINIL